MIKQRKELKLKWKRLFQKHIILNFNVMPGRYIELKDFDSEIDNQYYITKVCHEFTPGEYVVTLNLSTND